ncbi:hypothetical protein GE107_18075 [Cohnella sp. CFH 77786]|nr:hypothetical protein [Cohnella sp. CFH 77786]
MKGQTSDSISIVRPATEPVSQNSTSFNPCSFSTSIPCVKDVNNALTAAPARMIFRGVSPSRPAEPSKYTTAAPNTAPANEIHISFAREVTDNTVTANTTKKTAP